LAVDTKLRIAGAWVDATTNTRIANAWVETTTTPVVTPPVVAASAAARWWIPFGSTPHTRVTHETGINANGKAQVVWVGSMPDVRARTTPREMGVAAQDQSAYQAYIYDLTTSSIVADSGVVTGTAEIWEASSFVPITGRRYAGYARVRTSGGVWSSYASTRFVAPTGRVIYLEDYGAVPDGTTRSGTDYGNSIYNGPIRDAIADANAGDIIRSRKQGTILTGINVSGSTLTASSAVFSGSMVGKKVIIYGSGTTNATSDSYAFRTTISSVAGNNMSVSLANAVRTNQSTAKVMIDYAEYLTGHIDVDGGAQSDGGFTFDGTGCIFTSNDDDYAGFRTTLPDITYLNVHYLHKNVTIRGNGRNNNSGSFFIESTNAIGGRFIGCYAEHCRDAGFLFYDGCSDMHVVDCITDHSMADPFHVTGSAHHIQFIRNQSIYIGDDATANIGYRSGGDSNRPYEIYWENPKMYSQNWGRGLSFGGSHDCLATDVVMDGGAMASFLIGSDGDQANTNHVQVRGFTVTNPNAGRGTKPTYSQGSGTSSVIADDPWLKLLNSGSATAQSNILLENGTVTDGRYIQIISYGGGTFHDASVILRGITMDGAVNGGGGWLDQSTYSGHVDFRGITVPAGSTAAAAPSNPNS